MLVYTLQLQFRTVPKPTKAPPKKKPKTASSRPDNSTADRDQARPRGSSNGDVVPTEAERVQQIVDMPLLEAKIVLLEKEAPLDVQQASLDMNQAPLDLKMVPLDKEMTPLDGMHVPLDVKMAPLDSKMALLDEEMTLLDGMQVPLDVKMAAMYGLKPSLVKSCIIATACVFSVYGLYKMLL